MDRVARASDVRLPDEGRPWAGPSRSEWLARIDPIPDPFSTSAPGQSGAPGAAVDDGAEPPAEDG